jgi:gamma-glutamyl phosphate reductase
MLNDLSIENKDRWIEQTSDKVLSSLVESGIAVDVVVPYGSASFN